MEWHCCTNCVEITVDCTKACYDHGAWDDCYYCGCGESGERMDNPDGKGEGECCCGDGEKPEYLNTSCPKEGADAGQPCGGCLKCRPCKNGV